MKFSSMTALKVVILTTFGAANDNNFVDMTFSFQCVLRHNKTIGVYTTMRPERIVWSDNIIQIEEERVETMEENDSTQYLE